MSSATKGVAQAERIGLVPGAVGVSGGNRRLSRAFAQQEIRQGRSNQHLIRCGRGQRSPSGQMALDEIRACFAGDEGRMLDDRPQEGDIGGNSQDDVV